MELSEVRGLVKGNYYSVVTDGSAGIKHMWVIKYHHFDEERDLLFTEASLCTSSASFYNSCGRGGFAVRENVEKIGPASEREINWLQACLAQGKWVAETKSQINDNYQIF